VVNGVDASGVLAAGVPIQQCIRVAGGVHVDMVTCVCATARWGDTRSGGIST
jgi:hypothetical protein